MTLYLQFNVTILVHCTEIQTAVYVLVCMLATVYTVHDSYYVTSQSFCFNIFSTFHNQAFTWNMQAIHPIATSLNFLGPMVFFYLARVGAYSLAYSLGPGSCLYPLHIGENNSNVLTPKNNM